MTLDTYILFVPACFALNMAFGPNNLLSLTNAARDGVLRAVLASVGRLISFAVMIAIAALGLGAAMMASELIFAAVKWAGAAYLIWIGINLLRSGAPLLTPAQAAAPRSLKELALQELWVAAGNPKAILIFTAFFPQFVDPAAYSASFFILGVTFLFLEAIAITIYALLGARLGAYIRNGKAFTWFNRVSGGMMIGFGIVLLFTRRPAT